MTGASVPSVPHYRVYTDASCDQHLGFGTWAYVLVDGGTVRLAGGSLPGVRTDDAEAEAVAMALSTVVSGSNVCVFADCEAILRNQRTTRALAAARARGIHTEVQILPRNTHPHQRAAHQLARLTLDACRREGEGTTSSDGALCLVRIRASSVRVRGAHRGFCRVQSTYYYRPAQESQEAVVRQHDAWCALNANNHLKTLIRTAVRDTGEGWALTVVVDGPDSDTPSIRAVTKTVRAGGTFLQVRAAKPEEDADLYREIRRALRRAKQAGSKGAAPTATKE